MKHMFLTITVLLLLGNKCFEKKIGRVGLDSTLSIPSITIPGNDTIKVENSISSENILLAQGMAALVDYENMTDPAKEQLHALIAEPIEQQILVEIEKQIPEDSILHVESINIKDVFNYIDFNNIASSFEDGLSKATIEFKGKIEIVSIKESSELEVREEVSNSIEAIYISRIDLKTLTEEELSNYSALEFPASLSNFVLIDDDKQYEICKDSQEKMSFVKHLKIDISLADESSKKSLVDYKNTSTENCSINVSLNKEVQLLDYALEGAWIDFELGFSLPKEGLPIAGRTEVGIVGGIDIETISTLINDLVNPDDL